jgi:S-adenosylmethionine:tRNA-ribosyltransferase-isomerase (queuine synthetase)
METERLNYYLPADLIAQKPAPNRDSSRLLVLNRSDGSIIDDSFSRICGYLHKGDCLVINNTKVIPARFFAQRKSGAKIEGLFLSQTCGEPAESNTPDTWLVLLKNSSRIKEGEILYLLERDENPFCPAHMEKKLSAGQWLIKPDLSAEALATCPPKSALADEGWKAPCPTCPPKPWRPVLRSPPVLAFAPVPATTQRVQARKHRGTKDGRRIAAEKILESIGFAPLPPYIKRPIPQIEHKTDSQRYQTVYARCSGAIAAPTAGLHFTEKLLEQIRAKGIPIAQLTLHVGVGTFLPVKTENLEEHKIHSERFSIDAENADIINKAIRRGGRIIAVGTTTVRTLETAAIHRGASASQRVGTRIKPASGQTNLFITPGFEFKITDCLVTNFHLPKSTLLALVAAFAGLDKILAAYRHAIEQKYRFYSYGDCMLIV